MNMYDIKLGYSKQKMKSVLDFVRILLLEALHQVWTER